MSGFTLKRTTPSLPVLNTQSGPAKPEQPIYVFFCSLLIAKTNQCVSTGVELP